MKARRLPARSALEQLLHQVPQRRPRLLLLPPALLNRLRLLQSTPTSAAKTDTSSAPATKAKAPATAAVATAPTKPATSEAPKATAKPSAEAPEAVRNLPQRPKLHLRRNQQRNPRPLLRLHRRSLLNPQNLPSLKKPNPRSPQSKRAKPASHEAASKPFANKEHVAESAIEEATEKTPATSC